MSNKTPPNPLAMLGQIAGAVGGAVGDIVREVKQDLKEMTPPDVKPAKRVDAGLVGMVASAQGGLAHVDVGGPPLAPVPETDVPESGGAGRVINPWDDALVAGKMCVDACFVAEQDDDVTRYVKALERELDKPFTLGVVAADAGKPAVWEALQKGLANEPRLFGVAGFGPRSLQDDLDGLDDTLTNLLNEHPKVLAVGPLGIDEPYAPYTLPQQVEQMVKQLEIAVDFGLPALVYHVRSLRAMKQVLEPLANLPRLIWLNTLETEDDVALVRKLDAYVLIRPDITYEANRLARESLRRVVPERWLLGGGSSLLSPQPRSGHPNGPEGLIHTLKAFAAMLDKPVPEVRAMLNANARRVFVGG